VKACARQVESLTKNYTKLSNKIKECQEDNVKFDNQASDLRGKRTRIYKNSRERVKAIAKLKDEIVKAEYAARKAQEKFDQYPQSAIDELSVCLIASKSDNRQKLLISTTPKNQNIKKLQSKLEQRAES
jgi:SMC interacting uncharacterized protein involved in chromosome segregation